MESAWKFLIHVTVGAIQFVLILLVALALAGLVSLAQRLSFAPPWLVEGIEGVERVVFWADVLASGLFLTAEVLKLAAGLWWDVRDAWQERPPRRR
jgi:hypothetical protein